ncbi:MAG TPA: suppressor of fused domain protein [Candidatus Corynebacterium gallistercoris]|uniref:Suppressor of fused domain protein n=1 Tax=Candidatus Corynebacterium gallistercoris TaxID=2838530 RepID=A0A9D1UQ89_9CORY|nr:suppressor of fused domain protein [Candidatus Corynebacterium gallistercoris]
MNPEETFVWASTILPGEPTFASHRVAESFPEFAMAQVELPENEASPAETVIMTVDAARIEPGLETEDGSDLRVELITVVAGGGGVAKKILAHAATMISQDPFHYTPQPGTLLPKMTQGIDENITTPHGLLVVPFVWADGVPHVHEVASSGGGRHAKQDTPEVEFTHPGRLTVVAQVVMLTDEEYEIARTQGVEALQQHVVATGVNLNDVYR